MYNTRKELQSRPASLQLCDYIIQNGTNQLDLEATVAVSGWMHFSSWKTLHRSTNILLGTPARFNLLDVYEHSLSINIVSDRRVFI